MKTKQGRDITWPLDTKSSHLDDSDESYKIQPYSYRKRSTDPQLVQNDVFDSLNEWIKRADGPCTIVFRRPPEIHSYTDIHEDGSATIWHTASYRAILFNGLGMPVNPPFRVAREGAKAHIIPDFKAKQYAEPEKDPNDVDIEIKE